MELQFDYQSVPHNFVHCFNAGCAAQETCLRHQVGRLMPRDRDTVTVVNPRYAATDDTACPLFKRAEPVRMAVGITHLFDSLPHKEAVAVRKQLLAHFGRNIFYHIQNKKRCIYPDEMDYIRRAFAQRGIAEEPRFDELTERYDW